MKRIILFALLLGISFFTFAQTAKMTNGEIAKTISLSMEFNKSAGVINPDLIQPGQKLTYLFMDGVQRSITVENGDNQWTLVRDKLDKMIKAYGPLVGDSDKFKDVENKKSTAKQVAQFDWQLLAVILLMVIIIYIIIKAILSRNSKEKVKEVKGFDQINTVNDHPMKPGGVTDVEAPAYMQTVARRLGSNVMLHGPTTKGRLTTTIPVTVSYADGSRQEILTNESVFHSAATVDGIEQDIFFKEICGNDARAGRFIMLKEQYTFVPDAVQSTELRQSNQEVFAQRSTEMSKLDTSTALSTFAKMLEMQKNGELKMTVENGRIDIEAKFSNPVDVTSKTSHTENID